VIDNTLSLYDGFAAVRSSAGWRRTCPRAAGPGQMKRVLINLVDNAIEATEKRARSCISTSSTAATARVGSGRGRRRPRHPPEDRDKLFVPSFSTKRRGSGLGLAIVSRIVQEHQGAIRVEDNRRAARASSSSCRRDAARGG
jgi:signal transduction histidine kinase